MDSPEHIHDFTARTITALVPLKKGRRRHLTTTHGCCACGLSELMFDHLIGADARPAKRKEKAPSPAQIRALVMVSKRNWPAGEPRMEWINAGTARALFARGWIVERPDSATKYRGNIVDLTDAGRAILVQFAGAKDGAK